MNPRESSTTAGDIERRRTGRRAEGRAQRGFQVDRRGIQRNAEARTCEGRTIHVAGNVGSGVSRTCTGERAADRGDFDKLRAAVFLRAEHVVAAGLLQPRPFPPGLFPPARSSERFRPDIAWHVLTAPQQGATQQGDACEPHGASRLCLGSRFESRVAADVARTRSEFPVKNRRANQEHSEVTTML